MCREQGVRTNGCGTYRIGDTRGMAVLATALTHDGSDCEGRKRMASEQIGETCHGQSAEEKNAALVHSRVVGEVDYWRGETPTG
jgi:hypothetical protein